MVLVQEPISPNQPKTTPTIGNSTKKRKWEEKEEESLGNRSNLSRVNCNTKSLFDMEFNLESPPLPLEWKQYLDVQSGQIHFYNTTTKKRTFKDPRQSSPARKSTSPMSLELELNLPFNALGSHAKYDHLDSPSLDLNPMSNNFDLQNKNCGTLTRCTSWMSFEEDHKEMVADVCMQCHMLVMLCKSSPTCPNCKFIYPPGKSTLNLFKPRFSFLSFKD